jgi:hypothetical protein
MGQHKNESKWWKEKDNIKYLKLSSKRKAERLEEFLIIKYCPPYNVTLNDGVPAEYIEVKFDQLEWVEYRRENFKKVKTIVKKNPSPPNRDVITKEVKEKLREESRMRENQKWIDFFKSNRNKVERVYFHEDKTLAIEYKNVERVPYRSTLVIDVWNCINIIKGSYNAETGIGDFTIGLSGIDNLTIREALKIETYEPIDESIYYKTKYWNSIKEDYMNTFFDKCFKSDSPISLIGYASNTKLLIKPSELMNDITAVATTGNGEIVFFYANGRSARIIHWAGYCGEVDEHWLENFNTDDVKLSEDLRSTFLLKEKPKVLHFEGYYGNFIGCESEVDSWYLHYIFYQYGMREKNKLSEINTNTMKEGYGGDDFFLDMDLTYWGISYEEMNLNITGSDYEHLKEEIPNFGITPNRFGYTGS